MIVSIIPDRFNKVSQDQTALAKGSASAYGRSDVRRPVRGIQLKEDTYATIRVLMGDGSVLPLVNAGSRNGLEGSDGKLHSEDYSNFLIQTVTEERAEKQQIVETFGEAFIFFFGERPRILTVNGVLLNTFDFNWEAEWWWNYDHYLRGTKCVENDARVYLVYDDVMVSGYIMGANSSRQAKERNYVPFSFQLFVTDYTNLSRLGDSDPDQRHEQPVGWWDSANKFRPLRVSNNQQQFLNDLNKSSPSLFEAMATDAISTVQAAWSRVNSLVNNTISSVDAILGNPVRIPLGFEGALSYDEDKIELSVVGGSGLAGLDMPIRYTTKFGDNYDEFVADTSPYASSAMDIGESLSRTFAGVNEFNSAQEMVAKAQAEWAENGFVFPPAALSNTIALASQTGVGMQVVGAARKLLAGGTAAVGVVLSAGDSVVAGTSLVLGDAALADNVTNAVSPSAGAALDRAAAKTVPTSFDVLNGLKSFSGS